MALVLLLVAAPPAFAGTWEAAFGPAPAAARFVEEQVAPDLVRVEVEEAGGRYWMEVTPGAGGFCEADGLSLWVRRSLDDPDESFELDPPPPAVAQACATLAEAAPALRRHMDAAAPLPVSPGSAAASSAPRASAPGGERLFPVARPRPFQWVVVGALLVMFGAALAGARRGPRAAFVAAGLFLAALLVRVGLAPETVLLGGDAAFERLVSSFGLMDVDRYYGETWPSLLGLVHVAARALGLEPAVPTDVVHDVNLYTSALAPALLFLLARRLGLQARVAVVVGGALVLLPQAVHLARIEDHVVLVATLQLAAAVAVLGTTRIEAAAAVAAAVLLAHLRPEQVPVAALLLLPLFWRRHHVFGTLGVAGVAARLAYLPEALGSSPIGYSRLLDPGAWPRMLAAWSHAFAPWFPGLLVLVAVGLWSAVVGVRRPAGAWRWAAAVTLATSLVYLPKDYPAADPLRFSLPASAWMVLFATVGVVDLYTRLRSPRLAGRARLVGGLAAFAVVAASLWPASGAPGVQPRPWAWEGEYAFLRVHAPSAARGRAVEGADPLELVASMAGPVGWYDGSQDPFAAEARWLAVVTGMPWLPWGADAPRPGDLVYRGSADRLGELSGRPWSGQRCGLDPLAEEELPPSSDGWVDFGAEPVRVGLYAVRDCGAPADGS